MRWMPTSITKVQRLKKELDGAIKDSDFELALEVINDLIKLDIPRRKVLAQPLGLAMSKIG